MSITIPRTATGIIENHTTGTECNVLIPFITIWIKSGEGWECVANWSYRHDSWADRRGGEAGGVDYLPYRSVISSYVIEGHLASESEGCTCGHLTIEFVTADDARAALAEYLL